MAIKLTPSIWKSTCIGALPLNNSVVPVAIATSTSR